VAGTRLGPVGRHGVLGFHRSRDKNCHTGQANGLSAFGQKQTFAVQTDMSALLPKADMCGASRDVRVGPTADINSLSVQTIRTARLRGVAP